MVNTDGWSKYAREQLEFLRGAHERCAKDPEVLGTFIFGAIAFAKCIIMVWKRELEDLRRGGASAKEIISQCDRFLSQIEVPQKDLLTAAQEIQTAKAPTDKANGVLGQLTAVLNQIESAVEESQRLRDWAATPARITADASDLQRRATEADEKNEWLKLTNGNKPVASETGTSDLGAN